VYPERGENDRDGDGGKGEEKEERKKKKGVGYAKRKVRCVRFISEYKYNEATA